MKGFFAGAAMIGAVFAIASSARADYVAPHVEHPPYGALKIVVPVTSGDPHMWMLKLRNARNGIEAVRTWKGTLELRLVLWAQGVHMLDNPSPESRAAIDALRAAGVRFEVCANTLREQNIDFHALYGVGEADVVPSGFLEVPYLQQHEGFAVAPAN